MGLLDPRTDRAISTRSVSKMTIKGVDGERSEKRDDSLDELKPEAVVTWNAVGQGEGG